MVELVPEDLVFYTAAEVADLLRMNPQVIQRKLQAGEIPGYFVGRGWRVERGDLLGWLDRFSNQRQRPLSDRWFDKDGRIKSLPTQRAKRRTVLERVAELFEPGRPYPESEVNAVLRTVYDDVALLRRELVAEALLEREAGLYRRVESIENLPRRHAEPSRFDRP
jgi:excisionase family DNA binding protein